MKEYSEYQDFVFLNEDEFMKEQEQDFKGSLVKMKVFNKLHQEEFDRTVYLKLTYNTLIEINKCLEYIRRFHYSHAKSFLNEVIYKE